MVPKIADHSLDLLAVLADGEWHDREDIRKKLHMKFSSSDMARFSRIYISPLVENKYLEEDKIPTKEGSKKTKKVCRMIHDLNMVGDKANILSLLAALREQCEVLRDHYKMLHRFSPKTDKKTLPKSSYYQDLYNRFDDCYNHILQQVAHYPPDEWSPAMGKIMKLAETIEPHCKSNLDARLAIYKMDDALQLGLLKAHREWQLSHGKRRSTLCLAEKIITQPGG